MAHKFDGSERKQAIANLRIEFQRILETDPNVAELGNYELILVSSMCSIDFLGQLRSVIKENETYLARLALPAPNTKTTIERPAPADQPQRIS